jgi:predicted amidohydrolase YtcJ
LTRPTQLALHVVGDAETDRLLKMMEGIAPASARQAKRIRIEHGDGIRQDTMEQAARLGLVVIQNPPHLSLPPIAGEKMLDRSMLLKRLVSAGIPLAFGSDGGVKEQHPFLNLMLATLYSAEPGGSLDTRSSADRLHRGRRICRRPRPAQGTHRAGFAADLAVLSQDILTIPVPQLPATTSLLRCSARVAQIVGSCPLMGWRNGCSQKGLLSKHSLESQELEKETKKLAAILEEARIQADRVARQVK